MLPTKLQACSTDQYKNLMENVDSVTSRSTTEARSSQPVVCVFCGFRNYFSSSLHLIFISSQFAAMMYYMRRDLMYDSMDPMDREKLQQFTGLDLAL